MNNFQDKVLEFQLASGQPVSDTPRELTKEEFDFRDTLLQEEIRELQYAIADDNRVEILDALCDIIYVATGTCNAMGIKHDFELDEADYSYGFFTVEELISDLKEYSTYNYCISSVISVCYELAHHFNFTLDNFKTALNRVHESNLSKFCNDIKTAERTQEFYKKQGIDTYIEPRNKMTVVYRKDDGKVLKSIDYHPVYLEDLV